jgi:hypothetical protein
MDEEALLQLLEAGKLPERGLPHADHVRLAWYCLRQQPVLSALSRIRNALLQAARGAGRPERYHETMTVGYVLIIAERLGNARDAPWEVFAASNPDLLTSEPSVLARFYTRETLESDQARKAFVMPDRDVRQAACLSRAGAG